MTQLHVGVDWGHEHIQLVVERDDGTSLWNRRAPVSEIDAVIRHLRTLSNEHHDAAVAIAIERNSGRLVEQFLDAGFEVWFVRPAQVDDARRLRFASLAKDDLRDARTMAWMLRTMPEGLVRLQRSDPAEVEIRRLTRHRTHLVADRTAVLSQIIELFREHFPELLSLTDPSVRWFTALWRLVRTPQHASQVPLDAVQAVLTAHRVRKVTAEHIGTLFARCAPANADDSWAFEAELALDRLEFLTLQIERLEHRLDERLHALEQVQRAASDGLSDIEIVRSVAGAGRLLTAILIGERLPQLLRADLELARAITGSAPVLQTTGKRQTRGGGTVQMRRACNPHLRRALHLLIEKGMQQDAWMKQRYATLRARNHTHGRACRQMADGLLTKLRAMLRDRTLYTALPPTVATAS